MIDLPYSLMIEATKEPDYCGFHSPDLEGFTGIGHSIEDCIYRARWGMGEHVVLLSEQGLPVPPKNLHPRIIIQNKGESSASQKKPCKDQSSFRFSHSNDSNGSNGSFHTQQPVDKPIFCVIPALRRHLEVSLTHRFS